MPQTIESKHRVLLWLIGGAFFMELLDGTILNTSLPAMSKYFGQSPLRMQAVVIAYLLTVVILIPISGWIADRLGCRKVFIFAMGLFTFGSLLCSISVNLEMLVLCRIIQGIGGSMMLPVGRLIILKAIPREKLISALTFVTIPGLIGPIVGPILGGILVQYASWHWIFLINIPIGLFGMVLTRKYMPPMNEPRRVPFDWSGYAIFATAMVAISLALEGAGELHWGLRCSAILFFAGLLCMSFFWIHASRCTFPLFSTDLFKIRAFSVGITGNLFARLANGTIPFLTPLLLQVGLGFSPFISGLTMIPIAVFGIIGKSFVEMFLVKMGHRRFLSINTVILGILICGFAVLNHSTPYWCILVYLSVFGVINSMQFTAMNTLTLTELPNRLEGAGNGLHSVVMQMAASLGVGTAAMFLAFFSGHHVGEAAPLTPEDSLPCLHQTYIVMGLIAIVASTIFLFAPSRVLVEARQVNNQG